MQSVTSKVYHHILWYQMVSSQHVKLFPLPEEAMPHTKSNLPGMGSDGISLLTDATGSYLTVTVCIQLSHGHTPMSSHSPLPKSNIAELT